MENSELAQLRTTILKGMSESAEKLRKQKALLGRKLVISENGKVKLVAPDSSNSQP